MNNKIPDGMDSKISPKGEGNHPFSAKNLDQTLINHVQIDGTEQYKAQLALQHAHDSSVFEKMGAIATDAYNFFFPEAHASEIHVDNKEHEVHPLTIDEVMEKYVDKDSGALQEPPAYKEEPPVEHHEVHKHDQKELVQNEGGIQFDDGSAHYPLGLVQAGFITHGLTNNFFHNEGIRDLHHEEPTPETHSAHTPTVDLQITKVDDHGGSSITGSIGTAIPGQCITYTITVTNLGPDSVFGATVTDHLPSQLLFWEVVGTNGFTDSGTHGGSFTDYSVNLASGESVVYTVKAFVDPCASPCDTMTNTATVQAPDGVIDTNPNNNTAVDKDNISGEADLKIVKYDDHGGNSETGAVGCVTPGTCITYTVVVYNCGPAFVCGAEVKDILPHDLLNWNVVGSDGFTASGEQGGCFTDFINIAAGSSVTYTITGTIASDAACCDKNNDCGGNQTSERTTQTENQDCNSCDKTIQNVATVTAPGCYTDPNPGNNTAVDISKLTPQGDLKIEKYDDHGGNSETGAVGCVTPGTCITYTIVVSNCGPSDVCGAIVKDCLPDALLNWEVSGSNGFKASGCEGGTFTDNVYLEAGGTITYTIKGIIAADAACNTGCDDQTQMRTESQDGCCDPKYIQNTATVTAPDCFVDTNPYNNVAVDKSKLTPEGDLKIEKFDDHGGSSVTGCIGDVVPGTCITYTIVVTNCGPSDVCGAIVNDCLPSALINWEVSGSNGFQASGCEGGSFTDYCANIEAGCSITYIIKGTIAADAACNTGCDDQTQMRTESQDGCCDPKYIQNTATVTAPCGFVDTNPYNNTAVDVTKLSPEGDLKIVKYDDHGGNSETGCIGNITPGTCITYTIVVSNCGPSDVCGAIVKDCLPDALINWTVSGSNGFAACGWEGGSFADNYVNIAAGGTVTYTITGMIAPDAACGDDGKCCDPKDIQNVATVEAPCGFTDTNLCNNTAVDQSHLTPQVDLSVVKLVDGQSCETISACCDNKELTYTITVSNCGPSDACGVIVTDKLPAGLVIDSFCAPDGTSYNATTGVWTIGKVENCDSITLTIKAHVVIPAITLDFTHDADTSHVYAFKTGQGFESGNTLNLANANGSVSVTPDGLGVTTNYDVSHFTPSALPEINYDPVTGKTEALVFDLGESATKATIEASKFFPAENGGDGEYGVLTAYDANGHEVGKVYFGPAENGLPSELNGATFIAATFDGSGSIGTFSIDSSLFCGASFQYLAFTSLPYGAGVINNSPDPTGSGSDSGDYYIQKISYTPETTTIVNTAVVSSCTPDTNPDNDTSSATIKVENPHGDLSVVKYDDHGGNSETGTVGCVTPGTYITYTVVVSNCGPSDVCGAIIKDCLPDALLNWTVCATNGYSASGLQGGSFCDIASIEAGCTITYTIKGMIAADAACCDTGCGDQTTERSQSNDGCCDDKTIENKVTVTGPACFVDTNPYNNTAVDQSHLTPQVDLSVVKLVDGQSCETISACCDNKELTYTITVSNCGPSDACGVIVTDKLPAGLVIDSFCAPDGTSYNATTGVWTIGKVENCDTITLTIKAHVVIPAITLDFTHDADTSHVYAFKTGQGFESGNTLNLANANGSVSVTQDGLGVTTNYDVSHFTPSALPEINYDPVTGKTEALVFDLGESATKATIEASKFFPAENGGDGEYGVLTAFDANGHEVGKVYFGPAEAGLPSELNGATFIAATFDGSGSIGTFSIDSSLFSGASFQYLAFTALPYGAGVINNSPNPTGSGSDSGDYYIQKISYTPETTTIVNTAVVSSCTPDTNPDNDTSSATVKVENPHGDLSVIKYDDHGGNSLTGSIGNVIPGSCITYTVIVSNCGPSDVMGAIVKDCLPDVLQNWEVSGSNGFSASGSAGGSFTDYANIDAGATVTYTIKGTIAADAACCNTGCDDQTSERTTTQANDGCCDKTIENVVTVTGPACFVDTNPDNNVAVDKGVLKPEGDLSVTKYDNHGGNSDGCVGEVKVGDCITYTIVVTNSGPSDACGAILTDCLPKELLNWTVCGPDGFTASGCEGGSFIDCLNIPAGCSVTYTVTGTVGQDWGCDNYLSNTATIIAPECFNDTNDCNNTATAADVIKEQKQHGCGDHRDDRCNDRDRHDDKCKRDDRCDDKRHDDKCREERRHEGSEIAYCGIGAAVAHPKDNDFKDHNNRDDHKQNRDDNRHADNNQNCNSHCNDSNDKEHHDQQNTYHSQYADNNHHTQGSSLFLFAHDQLKDFHDKKDHDNDDRRDNKQADKNNNHHGNGEHQVAENKHSDDKLHDDKELKDTDKNHTQHFASCNDDKDHCEKVGDNKHKDIGDNGKDNHDCNDQKHCGVQMSDNHSKEDHCKGNEHNDCQQQVGHKVDGILCGVIDDHGCKGQLSLAQLLSNQHGDKDNDLGKALQDISEQAKHKNDCQTDQHNIECAQQAKVHDKVTPCLPHEHQVLSQMVEHHEMQQQAAHH